MGRPLEPPEARLRRSFAIALALVQGLAAAVTAPAARASDSYDAAPAAPGRPTYRTLRFEEDWSALRDPGSLPARDTFDPLKFIPLVPDGEVWLSLGAQARGRGDGWSNYIFGGRPGDDTDDAFFESRLRAHADLHLGRTARGFVELKSALVTHVDLPGGPGPARRDVFDVQNAFVDLTPPLPGTDARPLLLRGGRQELLFGAQRLVSPADWTNARRTFDGVSARLALGPARATGFWTEPVRVLPTQANDHGTQDEKFFGVYATSELPAGASADLYWLARTRDDVTVNGTTGDERRHTFGGRLFGNVGDTGLDYEVEAAFQNGSLGGQPIHASMVAAELGWWLVGLPWTPRFHAAFDYASGDRRPGDGVQTFDPLFPYGHRWLGQMDFVGRSNVRAVSGGVTLRPLLATTVIFTVHRFWLADGHDALYAANGAVLRPGIGAGRSVGTELDLEISWRFDPHTTLGAGYGHFFPDSFVRETGRARDADYVTLWLQWTM
jgi:hypothetical protein